MVRNLTRMFVGAFALAFVAVAAGVAFAQTPTTASPSVTSAPTMMPDTPDRAPATGGGGMAR
jgi:hypothetical protein